MSTKNLASRLCYLPLFVADRVKLWLTFKNLKPASLITLNPQVYLMTPKRLHRVLSWIKDAGLYSQLDPLAPKKNIFIVSKDPLVIRKIAKMKPPSYDNDQKKDTYDIGILLGFPPRAVKAYANSKDPSIELVDSLGKNSPVKNTPEALYANYGLTKGYEKEDIMVARKWMESIRTDIPKLARWYEREAKTAIEK